MIAVLKRIASNVNCDSEDDINNIKTDPNNNIENYKYYN